MNNLFEMMMQAQDGSAMDTLGKQFGLSQEQTEQALELMMPAFSNGLKRNTSDPMALMNFMSALSSGRINNITMTRDKLSAVKRWMRGTKF